MVWCESSPLVEKTNAHRRGRSPRKKHLQPSPYGAPVEQLAAVLAACVPDLRVKKSQGEAVVQWLPTIDGVPIASSPLIAEPPVTGDDATLTPWQITALPLTVGDAIRLLSACFDQTTLMTGVLVGSTLSFWATALRWMAALVAREQFLPDLQQANGQWQARWRPQLFGNAGRHMSQLAQAMPTACRALNASPDDPPQLAAATILAEGIDLLVDALVRGDVSTAVSASPMRVRKAAIFDSLHDQWLKALRSPDGIMRGGNAELATLAEQVRTWQRPAHVTASAPFRLCFRLEAPPAKNGESLANPTGQVWRVRYLLQAREDPSLLISVADAWAPRGLVAQLLKRNGFRSREYLLTALGQAAGLAAPIEASLKSPTPTGYDADVGEAHRFLTQTAWLLEQAGFGVLLPAWWADKTTKQRLTVRAHISSAPMTGSSGFSLQDLVSFQWRVALGDQELSLQELNELARLKAPLVRVRGQWVQVTAAEIEAALRLWKEANNKVSALEAVKMAVGVATVPAAVRFGGVTAKGWVNDLLGQIQGQATFKELPAPREFRGTLRPYQLRGYSWLAFLRRWGLGACLADDMGLGKTVQTLALLQHVWETGPKRPALLVCPMSVVGNWQKEAEKFTPQLPVLIHHGLQRARGSSFAKLAARHALVISSYGLLHRDVSAFQKVNWAGIILDEAQNIKNPGTKQAIAARSLQTDYRIALTGTPVENHVGDLWSIWQFLNPGFLGSAAEFRRKFFLPIQLYRDAEATQRLQQLTGPFLLRRVKTDKSIIADLPNKLEMKVYCNLTKEQASLYAAVVADLEQSLKDVTGIQRRGNILAALTKLKQVCNHPVQFLGDNSPVPGRSGKLARLTEMIDEVLQSDDRALIFTQFTEMGEIIRRHLQETLGQEVLFLHGGVSRKQRDHLVSRFQQEDSSRLFLLSLKAGGMGLNLTAANHVFHFDRWWNPAVEDQATDRAFRIGQRRNVQVHKFLCVGTLEEKIDAMLERKQAVATRVVGTGEAWLTELSNDQLRDLIQLQAIAVGE